MAQARVIEWNAEQWREARPGVSRATVATDQLTLTLYRYEAGSVFEVHSHPEDQATIVLSGGPITFTCQGQQMVAAEGDVVIIPGGLPHGAALGDAGAVTLNIFPPRPQEP